MIKSPRHISISLLVAAAILAGYLIWATSRRSRPPRPAVQGFESFFPYKLEDREREIGIEVGRALKDSHVIFVYIAETRTDWSLRIDGSHIEESQTIAMSPPTHPSSEGLLVIAKFDKTTDFSQGGVRISLDLGQLSRRQRVAIDTSGIGARIVYLREGEGFL